MRFAKPLPLRLTLSGAAWLSFALPPVLAQTPGQPCLPPRIVVPCPSPEQVPARPEEKADTSAAPPAAAPTLPTEQAAAAGGETYAAYAPNMIGNLLGAGRSVSFFINRTQGAFFVNNLGATNIVNPKVADNNSPLPQDRLSFRYNYFSDALSVTGVSGAAPVLDPSLGPGTFRQLTTTRSYDVHQFTFGFEKTLLDGLLSAEVRIPFSRTLSSNLNLSAGTVTGLGPFVNENGIAFGLDAQGQLVPVSEGNVVTPLSSLQVVQTPSETLGRSGNEFGNVSLIFKGLLHQSRALAVSAGLGVGIPTADDTQVRVTDFLGDVNSNNLEVQRVRDFHIENNTWSLSPFLAVLATPSDRFFAQGFWQFDLPLNSSRFTYTETVPIVLNTAREPFVADRPGVVTPPILATGRLDEQYLMQLDVGLGYWLLRDPDRRGLTGLAPTLELHYTTTLNNADLVVLPRDPSKVIIPGPDLGEPQPATIGNRRNRVDILDMTVGVTSLIGERATLATAVAFPLKGADNRTYDWEFQLQFNYYFGGPVGRSRGAPAF
jgi:hypothetical protein